MLHVRVFGGLALEGEGCVLPRSRRARGLLAWLACNPGMHARSKVAGLFWPDVLDDSARTSLRAGLAELRGALGPAAAHLVATRDQVGLMGDDLEVDVRAFEELLAHGRAEDALALASRGELLAGLEDEWVHEARDQALRRRLDALTALGQEAEAAGDLPRAVRYGRELARLDPLSEEAGRELIRLLGTAGGRAAAMTAYDALARRMRDSLALSPSATTRAVVEAVAHAGSPPAPEQAALPSPLARTEASPFVGRRQELAALRSAWARVAEGQGPSLVLLGGEAGIGKSRLAAELARGVHADGGEVLLGRCDEDPLAPYQPVAEMLRHAARAAATLIEPELAAIVPELAPRGDTPSSVDPVAERGRLFAAVGAAVGRIASRHPLLIVLEDLHWADRPTLLMLSYIVRFPPAERLLLLCTYRDTDVARDSPVSAWLEARRRDDSTEPVVLSGLDQPAVATLVSSWIGEPIEDLARRLHERTAGNALFVEEVLKRVAGGARTDEAVPSGVTEAISARLAGLSTPGRALLRTVSVAGRDVDAVSIAAATGTPREQVVEAVDELLAARVLREGDARGQLEFTHALLRDAVYQGLTATRRTHLHEQIAAALEAADPERYLEEIAHHLFRAAGATEVERAVDYLERAAARAMTRLAYEDAAEHADRALTLLEPASGNPAGVQDFC